MISTGAGASGKSEGTLGDGPAAAGARGDLVGRLTSRKFLLAVGTVVGMIAAWAKGALPPQTAAIVILVTTSVYILAEAYVDAAQAP